jgi:glycosyltransferase involved in cell wall biosynthesis
MNKKKKIVFIGLKGMPPRSGGYQFDAEIIGNHLIKEGYQLEIFCRKWYQEDYLENEYNLMKLRIINTPKRPIIIDVLYHDLMSCYYTIKDKADIAYLFGPHSYFLIFIFKLFSIKTIIRRAGFGKNTTSYSKIIRSLITLNEYLGVRFADVVTAETIVEKEHAEKYSKKKIIITPVGFIGKDKLQPILIKEKFNLDQNQFILFIGRFVRVKRIEWLIQSFLAQENTSYLKLVIAGSSLDENYNNYLHKISNDPRILFTGNVIGQLKDELISNCLCMVLPSESEGMSTAVAETLSFGSVCLLSNIDVHKWIINDEKIGLLFDKNDPDDLTRKLSDIIQGKCIFDENYIREKSLERFHLRKILDDITRLIEELN